MNDRERFEAALQLFATLQPLEAYGGEVDALVDEMMAMVGLVSDAAPDGAVEVPCPPLKQIVH